MLRGWKLTGWRCVARSLPCRTTAWSRRPGAGIDRPRFARPINPNRTDAPCGGCRSFGPLARSTERCNSQVSFQRRAVQMASRARRADKTKQRRKSNARRSISPTIRQLVLLESGYMCSNPRCRRILTLELHHIVWVRDNGGNEVSNLIALCPNCHSLHTTGHIPAEAIRVWKGMLLSINNANRANLDILLQLCRQTRTTFGQHVRYSGEALLQLAGLLNAGLIETGSAMVSSGGAGFPPYSSYELTLTPSSEALVEA